MKIKSINPATGETLKIYDEFTVEQVQKKITDAEAAFTSWRTQTFQRRAGLMKSVGDTLLQKKNELATLMASEMGKPFKQGIAEVEKCALVCKYYAENAENFLRNDTIKTEGQTSYVSFEPLGPILAVMPWNFPLWQVFRFAAPTIMAGNVAILKHASNVSGCSLAIESIFVEAGFPQGVFVSLLVSSQRINDIISNPKICAVTLTGSTAAGKAVAEHAGRELKKTVLELGGSDAYIVLDDANLDLAAEICVQSRLINSGQSCIAAKRFIVLESVYQEFTKKFIALMKSKIVGAPLNPETAVGPLARHDLRDELHQQVLLSVQKGAKLELGGELSNNAGAYYPPTVLTQVGPGMPAYNEELFGPVAAIMKVKDEEEAIRTANDSVFGLGAAIFSADVRRAENISKRLRCGSVFINSLVFSDARLPFGGIKKSGYGRELGSYGIKEFVNIKTIYIK